MAGLAFAFAMISMLGWIFNAPAMRTLIPGYPPMIPITAGCITLLAMNVVLAWREEKGAPTFVRTTSFFLSAVLIILSVSTLLFHFSVLPTAPRLNFLFGFSHASDGMLLKGIMSVQTSLCVLLLTATILLNQLRDRRARNWLNQTLPFLTLSLCLLACLGYIHQVVAFYGTSQFVGMSVPTAASMAVLAFGVLALRYNEGVVGFLLAPGAASLFLRRFIAFSVLGPLIITTIIVYGQRENLYPAPFSNALFVVLTILILVGLSLFTAHAIQASESRSVELEKSKAKTALLEAESNLQDTERRLQLALDASNLGMWELDLITDRAYLSSSTEKLFGYEPGTFPGTRLAIENRVHPEDLINLLEVQNSAILKRTELIVDLRCIWPSDQSAHWVRCRGRAKYDTQGNPLRLIGTALDVTAEKSYQKTLEDALQAAESANQLKSNFLASMSHEIRTPLGAILGFTELLMDAEITQDERIEFLNIISRSGETLSQLINDILDLSKVEAGHLEIEHISFPLRDLVNEILNLLGKHAQEKAIALKVFFADDLPHKISTDPTRLKQILLNLVGNAIKFTQAGEVAVTVAPAENGMVNFEVEDTGIGISEEQRQKLFQPFTQADGSVTRKFGGTGLGLNLSKRLARLLDGDIVLKKSQPGQGSVFVAMVRNHAVDSPIPVSMREIQSQKQTIRAAEQVLRNMRVLVVDDSLDNQSLLGTILSRHGAEVGFASNGFEATQKAASEPYDVILMDIQMPVMDGYTAATVIRAQNFSKPIIAITAHAMGDVRRRCQQAGCTDSLTKPIMPATLVQTLRRFTRHAQDSAGASQNGSPTH
ncbi:MAG: ATP-binding protein [Bdellovibrionales bacterium]